MSPPPPVSGGASMDAGVGTVEAAKPPAVGTAVRIDRSAHPDRSAHVSVGHFDGPLALLLGLIEQRQLDILEVPLGDLAGAYLEALATLEASQLPHVSSFISLASQLILIKSRAILPRPPATVASAEEALDPEAELRERLLQYRRFRDAGARLAERLACGLVLFHREAAAASASALRAPRPPAGPPQDPALLAAALGACLRLVPAPLPPPEVMQRLVTLEERAAAIRTALRRAPAIVLQELLRGVRDRVVVAVTFMAMLELVKGRELWVEQTTPFGPIHCHALTPADRRGEQVATW